MNLFQLIHEDWVAHQKDWTLPGFRAVAICRFGKWRQRFENRMVRAPFSLLYRALYRRARSVYGIELPFTVELGRRVVIEHQGTIVIHGECKIGDDCIIRQGVTLGVKGVDYLNDVPVLGNRVDLGAGSKILGKITLGDDVVVGANAVVTKDVPSNVTVAGIPARPV